MMKIIALIAALLISASATANAAGCSNAAARAAAETGGKVIGVNQRGNVCVITVLVSNGGGQPPKRVRVTYPAG